MKNLLVLLSLVVLFVSLPSVVFASLPPGFDGFEYVEQPEASQTAGTAEEEVVPPLEIKVNFVDEVEEAAQAELDARRDAENHISSGSWFAFGFFCGGIGVISAYLMSDVTMQVVGRSSAYVETYARVYKSVARERQLKPSIIGWKSSIIGCLIPWGATSLIPWGATSLYWLTR